jgi:LysM repeat protein
MAHMSIAEPTAAGPVAPVAASVTCLACVRGSRRASGGVARSAAAARRGVSGWRGSSERALPGRAGAATATLRRPAARPGRTRRDRPPLRLTRRGRVVVTALVGLLLCVALSVAKVTSSASTTPAPARHSYVVRPGDTLWGIASRLAPGSDPRVMVADLQGMNGLATTEVVPGQTIRLP